MRKTAVFYLFAGLASACAALGLQLLMRRKFPIPPEQDVAQVVKPSYLARTSAAGTPYDTEHRLPGERAPAGGLGPPGDETEAARWRGYVELDRAEGAADADPEKEDERDRHFRGRVRILNQEQAPAEQEEAEEYHRSTFVPREGKGVAEPAPPAAAALPALPEQSIGSARTERGLCQSIEYRGDGPRSARVTDLEWAVVTVLVDAAKDELLGWLEEHQSGFPDKTVVRMRLQLQNLAVERPPPQEEPDLAWRGIGVWTTDAQGRPAIRMGSGLVKLAAKDPRRAKFEITRLAAQSWAPCELQRAGADAAWAPLLRCLKVEEEGACGAESYSEPGWAVSSALAVILAGPGCTLPAFEDTASQNCLRKVPTPLQEVASL